MIRVGLIGAGAIGAWHARILAEAPQARLAAVCDVDAARAEALAAAYGCTATKDPEIFFALPLDAVAVASPEDVHLAHVEAAARAGLHVLVEKPVAATVAEIEAMIAACRSAGIVAMAGHVERFEPGSAGLHAAVSEGVCGPVSAILARRQFGPSDVGRFAGRSTTLRVLAVHDFDLLRWVHPAPILSVHAVAAQGAIFAATGLDDHVVTTVRFTDGAIAAIESGWTLPPSYGAFASPMGWQGAGNNRLEVFGRDGFVSNDMGLRGQQLVAFAGPEGFRAAGLRHQPVVHGRVQGALRAQLEHFLGCIATGARPLVGLEDARRAVVVLAAAEAALATGAPQAVSERD